MLCTEQHVCVCAALSSTCVCCSQLKSICAPLEKPPHKAAPPRADTGALQTALALARNPSNRSQSRALQQAATTSTFRGRCRWGCGRTSDSWFQWSLGLWESVVEWSVSDGQSSKSSFQSDKRCPLLQQQVAFLPLLPFCPAP